MNSHPDRQGYPLSSRNGLPRPLFLQCGSCWWVCLSFQHGFLVLRLYVFILFYLFFCQCIQPRASITLMRSKGPCLIFIDFQRSIWFSSANPLAPQVCLFFFPPSRPLSFLFYDLTTFVLFSPGEQQQTQPCQPWFPSAFKTRCPVCVAHSLHSMTPKSQLLLPIPAASISNINQTAQKAQSHSPAQTEPLAAIRIQINAKRRISVLRLQGQVGKTILLKTPIDAYKQLTIVQIVTGTLGYPHPIHKAYLVFTQSTSLKGPLNTEILNTVNELLFIKVAIRMWWVWMCSQSNDIRLASQSRPDKRIQTQRCSLGP